MLHRDFRCEFYFIRHGESASNATPGFAAGKNFDAPLTPLGVEQARLLGKRFQKEKIVFDRIYSSSLQRAVQTTDTMMDSMQCAHTSFTQVDAIIEQQVPGFALWMHSWKMSIVAILQTMVCHCLFVAYRGGKKYL